jgi:hypothetical protein
LKLSEQFEAAAMEPQQPGQAAEATAAGAAGVVLRVKRRRDCQVPQQIGKRLLNVVVCILGVSSCCLDEEHVIIHLFLLLPTCFQSWKPPAGLLHS